MQRMPIAERPNWQAVAAANGFTFHHINGERYWDESACWAFGLREIEQRIEDPSTELYAMCLALVDDAVRSQHLMERLAIPRDAWDFIARSWFAGDPSLYGRFDLAYGGDGPAKLLEFNADTPTSIYETACFQWLWLEDCLSSGTLPAGADQFNRLHEALMERFAAMFTRGSTLHFSAVAEHVEDRQTVLYLEDLATQSGLRAQFVAIDRIGLDSRGRLIDEASAPIGALFKLFPWEHLLVSDYAANLPGSGTLFIEPPWKAILSNKAMLALLWERHRGHPNLLPTAFATTDEGRRLATAPHARKPFFSREGADIWLFDGESSHAGPAEGYGAEGHIVQAFAPLARVDGNHAVLGSWIVGDEAVALSIREDSGPITHDTARFIPHVILGD